MSGVLAVVPCLNEAPHLRALLARLVAEPGVSLVVVADGGSTDGSRAIVGEMAERYPSLRLMDNPARIQSAGVNLAVKKYGQAFDWLLRVDAHCSYPDGYASKLLAAAARTGAQAVVVPMLTKASSGFQMAVATAQNSVIGTGGSPHRHLGAGRFVDHGHHALINMHAFIAAGGYCEAMPCNEDAELDHRLARNGNSIWLEPSAAIGYFPRSSVVSLWRQYFNYGMGRARMLRRHHIRPALRQRLPLLVPIAVALAFLAPIHWVFLVPLGIWASLMIAAGLAIGTASKSYWGLLSGLAAAIMHMAWGAGYFRERLRASAPPKPRYGFDSNEGLAGVIPSAKS